MNVFDIIYFTIICMASIILLLIPRTRHSINEHILCLKLVPFGCVTSALIFSGLLYGAYLFFEKNSMPLEYNIIFLPIAVVIAGIALGIVKQIIRKTYKKYAPPVPENESAGEEVIASYETEELDSTSETPEIQQEVIDADSAESLSATPIQEEKTVTDTPPKKFNPESKWKKIPVLPGYLASSYFFVFFVVYLLGASLIVWISNFPSPAVKCMLWENTPIESELLPSDIKIDFQRKRTHPFLAEFTYRLKVVKGDEEKIFPMHGGEAHTAVNVYLYDAGTAKRNTVPLIIFHEKQGNTALNLKDMIVYKMQNTHDLKEKWVPIDFHAFTALGKNVFLIEPRLENPEHPKIHNITPWILRDHMTYLGWINGTCFRPASESPEMPLQERVELISEKSK